MNATGPCITVNLERVSAEDVAGMVRHDMRIASLPKPGLGYGPYPNYVHVDKIKDNVVIKKTTAKEIHEEFDRRLKHKNDRVEGHNELVKERRKQLREEGVDEEKIEKEGGKFQRSIEKSAFTHRAYSLVLGLSEDAFDMLGADVPRSTVNEILITALRAVTKEIGIDEDELSHVVIHWDETHPHLHAGLPYLNKFGERFQKNFSPAFLSKLIRKVNLDSAKYGMKPPKTYKERGKRETHKSTKELKKETQRAHEIFLEHSSKAEKAKKEAELAGAQAEINRAKLVEAQLKNADLDAKLGELARVSADLESMQAAVNMREIEASKKEKDLVQLQRTLGVKEKQNKEFEKHIDDEVRNLQASQEQLKTDQGVLDKERGNISKLKNDAEAYKGLKSQVGKVLGLLLKLDVIQEALRDNTILGKAISNIAALVDFEMPEKNKGPVIGEG